MSFPVARLEGVSKVYRKGVERGNLRAAIPGARGEASGADKHIALSDVTLEIDQGEGLCVMGPNGAGKTTLLKLVAGVMRPTKGSIYTRGRVTPMIELGIGFDPDLTGAENILFTGALLSMGKRDIARAYDSIVEFAGIEEFLHTPVKRYSRGMRARLGLALALHAKSDLFVIDEALAVGDQEFRLKGIERLKKLREQGASLLVVSHDLWLVTGLCGRAVLLERGRIVHEGTPIEVAEGYAGPGAGSEVILGRAEVRLRDLHLEPETIRTHEHLDVSVKLEVATPLPSGILELSFLRADGFPGAPHIIAEAREALRNPGSWVVRGRLFSIPFGPGAYTMQLRVLSESNGTPLSRAIREVKISGDQTVPRLILQSQWQVKNVATYPEVKTESSLPTE